MGKPTGFMEYARQDRGYKPVEERITHFEEFVIPLSEQEISKQGLDKELAELKARARQKIDEEKAKLQQQADDRVDQEKQKAEDKLKNLLGR